MTGKYLSLFCRLQDMSQGCIRVWVKKIKNDYSKYLETCKSELWQRKETLEKETNGMRYNLVKQNNYL